MTKMMRVAGLLFASMVIAAVGAFAQGAIGEVMRRHGVDARDLEVAFDAHAAPTVAVSPGALATPLAMLSAGKGNERIVAAYAFGILAGRAGRAATAQELATAGQALVEMIGSSDRRARVAGARVAGRLFASPFDGSATPPLPQGLIDRLFTAWNLSSEVDQLIAMDALGLVRERSAVAALTERYRFYRDANARALAGGALEALARIGDASSADLVRQAAADPWSAGNDPTALAVAFARERLLKDGSVTAIRKALADPARQDQARGYLLELGVP